MKKVITVLLATIISFALSMTVSAQEGQYSTAGDLYQAWYDNLPDYICGIWSTDGSAYNLTFGIKDNDEGNAGREDILYLIEDDSTVSFVYQKYSRNYLLKIQSELNEYFEKDVGLISSALNETENRIDLGFQIDRADDEATKKAVSELIGKYSDAIFVEYTDQTFDLTLDTVKTNNNPPYYLLGIFAAFCFLAFSLYVFIKKRNVQILQTNTGKVLTSSENLTAKEVEDLIKSSDVDFPHSLDSRISTIIDNESENKYN